MVCVIDNENMNHSGNTSIVGYPVLYKRIKKYLSDGFGVIYAVEPSCVNVIKSMSATGIDTGNYINRAMLTVVDRNKIWSFKRPNGLDTDIKHNALESIMQKTKEKANYDKLVIMASTATFFETDNLHKIVDYERSMREGFDQSVEIVCCYPQMSVRQLRLPYLISVLQLHTHTIHKGWCYSDWGNDRIIHHINNGINKALGQKGAKIVLGNLKAIHDLDENMIVAHPEIFEERLRRMMGQSTAEKILKSIAEELEGKMKFYAYKNNEDKHTA